jgi:hypothetical protein
MHYRVLNRVVTSHGVTLAVRGIAFRFPPWLPGLSHQGMKVTSTAEVRNEWSYTPTHPYAFMACVSTLRLESNPSEVTAYRRVPTARFPVGTLETVIFRSGIPAELSIINEVYKYYSLTQLLCSFN